MEILIDKVGEDLDSWWSQLRLTFVGGVHEFEAFDDQMWAKEVCELSICAADQSHACLKVRASSAPAFPVISSSRHWSIKERRQADGHAIVSGSGGVAEAGAGQPPKGT